MNSPLSKTNVEMNFLGYKHRINLTNCYNMSLKQLFFSKKLQLQEYLKKELKYLPPFCHCFASVFRWHEVSKEGRDR